MRVSSANVNLPMYQRIRMHILDMVNSGELQPHDPVPSENQLARELGTSRQTVRKAFDILVHDNILYRIQGKGTFVQSPQVLARSGLVEAKPKVGLVLPLTSDDFLRHIIVNIENTLEEHGIQLLLRQTQDNQSIEEVKIESLLSEGVEGIILFTSTCPAEDKHLDGFLETGIPFVFIDRYLDGVHADVVAGEDFEGAYEATRHLISHGYSHIGYFDNTPALMSTGRDRLAGLKKALEDSGLQYDERLVVKNLTYPKGLKYQQLIDSERQSIIDYLLNNPELDAILTLNDSVAIKFYFACRQLGKRIPEDLAIIGFSDWEIDPFLYPQLTSVNQNSGLLGRKAAELMIRRIKEKGPKTAPEFVRVPYELKIRQSCGCK